MKITSQQISLWLTLNCDRTILSLKKTVLVSREWHLERVAGHINRRHGVFKEKWKHAGSRQWLLCKHEDLYLTHSELGDTGTDRGGFLRLAGQWSHSTLSERPYPKRIRLKVMEPTHDVLPCLLHALTLAHSLPPPSQTKLKGALNMLLTPHWPKTEVWVKDLQNKLRSSGENVVLISSVIYPLQFCSCHTKV